jgi:hypothetical protein
VIDFGSQGCRFRALPGAKASTRAFLQAINEAEKSLEERKHLPKSGQFLGEPPFFWVCGSEGAEESVQCRWPIVLSLQGCSLRSSKKKHLSEVSRRRSLIRRVVEVNYLA